MILSKYYEQNKMFEKSISILEVYKNKLPKSSDVLIKTTIDKKIQSLKDEQLKMIQE